MNGARQTFVMSFLTAEEEAVSHGALRVHFTLPPGTRPEQLRDVLVPQLVAAGSLLRPLVGTTPS